MQCTSTKLVVVPSPNDLYTQSRRLPVALVFAEEYCLNTYSVTDNLLSEVRWCVIAEVSCYVELMGVLLHEFVLRSFV